MAHRAAQFEDAQRAIILTQLGNAQAALAERGATVAVALTLPELTAAVRAAAPAHVLDAPQGTYDWYYGAAQRTLYRKLRTLAEDTPGALPAGWRDWPRPRAWRRA